jgi:hypothetical protein
VSAASRSLLMTLLRSCTTSQRALPHVSILQRLFTRVDIILNNVA